MVGGGVKWMAVRVCGEMIMKSIYCAVLCVFFFSFFLYLFNCMYVSLFGLDWIGSNVLGG